jgi:O-antigen ligase
MLFDKIGHAWTIWAVNDVGSEVAPQRMAGWEAATERATFWLFIAGLAWTPFWYGSNDLVAWGANAVLFPGLAAVYEMSLLIRGQHHPVGIKTLRASAALFAAVVLWIFLQNATWAPAMLAHPIWEMASDALGRPLEASISVNRDLTTLALVRLMTAASVFWVALQLCRNSSRASHLIESIAAIGCMYALYGLVAFAFATGRMPWFEAPSTRGYVSSTFINRNSFATYAGIGLLAVCGLLFRLYRHEAAAMEGPWRLRIASFIETTGQRGAVLLAAAFVLLAALLLSGSRGGIIAAALGLLVLAVLTLWRGERRSSGQLMIGAFAVVLVATAYFGFGDVLLGVRAKGIGDTNRLAVYLITLRSILDAPLLGYGYGTFADVFPMYRDRSISAQGVWEQAHNTYLELFQGLGVVFGAMLAASVLLLVLSCAKGAITRRENSTIPGVAASVAFLVAIHALVDFGLQIQAVTLTFMAVLGAGVAQSASSRKSLAD